MSDHTHLIARVAARNPVPDVDQPPIGTLDHEALRLVLTRREHEVQTQERTTPSASKPPERRNWMVAAASFAVVVLVGAIVMFAGSGGETPSNTEAPVATTSNEPTTTAEPSTTTTTQAPTTQAPPPTEAPADIVEAASRLVTAVYEGDLDAALAGAAESTGATNVEFDAGLSAALEASVTTVDCQPSATSQSVVECDVTYADLLHDRFGIEGSERWTIRFTDDGLWLTTDNTTTGDLTVEDWLDTVIDQVIDGPCNGLFGGDSPPADCAAALLQLAPEATS